MARVMEGRDVANARPRGARVKGATRKDKDAAPTRAVSAWLNRLIILAGSIVVLAASLQAYITLQSLPVKQISVTGKLEHTRKDEIQQLIQPALSGGFLNADLTLIREQLQGLPWIYEVNVRRRWPSALEIHVVEQLPIARWGELGFLNHQAQVFQTNRQGNWDDLPLLQGPEGTARVLMANYQRLEEFLQPLRLEVTELSLDERGQLEAVLQGDTRVLLGQDEFVERVKRLVSLYQGELAGRRAEVARVDLRYESGLAVVFRELETQVAGVATESIRTGE